MLEQPKLEGKITPRGQKLRKALERKMIKSDNNLGITTTGCIERSRYMTESMKQTETEPMPIRRAKALANYLAKKTIFIFPDELITGHLGHDIKSVPILMDYYSEPTLRSSVGSKLALTEAEWKEFEELITYWRGRTFEDISVPNLPEDIKARIHPPDFGVHKNVFSTLYRYGGPSSSANFNMMYSLGLNGIKKKIEASYVKYDPGKCEPALATDYVNRRIQLKAMLIACDAVINYVNRYAKLATEEAAKENDPVRKAELLEMAKNCNIADPCTSFQQAVQIAWFEHMISRCQETSAAGSPHRFDQHFYPYYKHDIEHGHITQERAREILEDLWLKYERVMGMLAPAQTSPSAIGSNMLFQHITLGGVDEFGHDVTNDLTYLMLDISKNLHSVQPALSIRVHNETPDALLAKAWDVLKEGGGNPSFFSDKPVIEHLLDRGVTLKDARNNCVAGCVAICIDGKNSLTQLKLGGAINTPHMLSLALNDGVDIMTGQMDPVCNLKTGDPTKFKTYEEVFEAFRKQMVEQMYWGWRASQIVRNLEPLVQCVPFISSLNEKCVEEGLDAKASADYWYPFFGCCSGAVDAGDALAAIKKLVFDEKKVTMDELTRACKANWVGYENIQKMCKEAPKFGNDDPYVDSIVKDVFDMITDEAAKFKDMYGAKYDVQFHSVSTFMTFGMWCPALPNGRKNGEPLSDGGISPEQGAGKEPTRVLKSVSVVDASKTQRILHNMRLSPSTTPRQFIDLMRAWNDLGLSQIQFNVFKTETLRDAQKKPTEYSDLLVRVAGFSAVFVNLNPVAQETIISRSELTAPKSSC
jgi:formate C-acetyltransferase